MKAKDANGWPMIRLRDACDLVQYGYTASATQESVGPKFLRITDIAPPHLNWDSVPYCPIDNSNREKYLLRDGDIVIARTGATVGFAKRISHPPDAVFASYLIRIRLNKEMDNRYVGFIIESDEYKRFIKTHVGGAAQPNANAQVLTSFLMPFPSLPAQRKIASILSAYDDLIENNVRRMKILEEIAHALYREWFVHFRFPGHEKVELVDSPIGKIPEGWEVSSFSDVSYNFDRLRKPLSQMERSTRRGPFPYYGAAKVFDYINDYIFDGDYLLVAEDGSVITPEGKPVLQLASGKFWANNHTHIIQGKDQVSTEYLYLRLFHLDVKAYVTGAAQPKITQANLNRIPVMVAPSELLIVFNSIVRAIFRQIKLLQEKTRVLRQTRDFLLPKLISGDVDVSNLAIATGAQA